MRHIWAAALAVAALDCRPPRQPAAGPLAALCADPGVDVSGWKADSGRAFTLRVPPGMGRRAVTTLDSEGGEWVGGGRTLAYDYGWYSNDLGDVDARYPEAAMCDPEGGGRPARVAVYPLDGGRYGAAAHWATQDVGAPRGQASSLTLSGVAPDLAGLRQLVASFYSVRLKRPAGGPDA